jgi:two-component system chemotaxis sensor kinase CheA
MSFDPLPELSADLLDDFYSECEDHLANIRGQLAALDESLARTDANPAALESLYRSVHSFKGNAAIVGLASAERLAHAAEDVLRRLTRGETKLDAPTLDVLARSGHRLEQIVSAFRLRQPLPEKHDLLAALGAPHPAAAPEATASVPPPAPDPADAAMTASAALFEEAQARGLLPWHATFAPSPALDERGVNIGTVRPRLAALGEILSAAPIIATGGKMTFEFNLALREAPAEPAAWEADGVTFHPADVAPPKTPEADPAAAAAPSSMFTAPSHIVRVDLGRLDDLMRIAGEMVIHRSRLEERIARVSGDRSALQETNAALARSLRELRETITRVRLVSVAEIFTRLPFVLRDLGHDSGKKVRLVTSGHDTEIDKYLVERLKEPLLHLVRNAVSHGIEPPLERIAAGKPPEGTLSLRAATAGNSVLIQIRDDGRGIDAPRVAARAKAAGLAVPEVLDEPALLNLIATPGFSTRDEADRAAGRGVGMDVVARTMRELGGQIALATEAGKFTEFTLRLPLTLSIAETFIVSAGGRTCAVPQSFVQEIVQVPAAGLRRLQRVEVAPYRDGVLPLVRLHTLLGLPESAPPQLTVLVVDSERGCAGLVVDRVHGQREVVVRPMQDPLLRVPGVSGATELGDGKPVLILDPALFTRGAVRPHAAAPESSPLAANA